MESIERARRATWLARVGTAAAMTSALALGTAGSARGLVRAVGTPAVSPVSPVDPPIAATGQPARSRTAESILSIIGVAATLALGARELAKQWPATDRA